MKKIIFSAILAFVCIAMACVKKPPSLNCGKLPCPTAKGANVVSCMINGKPYIAKGGKSDLTAKGGCKQGSYYQDNHGSTCNYFSFNFCNHLGYNDSIHINLYDSLAQKKYKLDYYNNVRMDGFLLYGTTSNFDTGFVTITTITDKIIAGTFAFTVRSNAIEHGRMRVTEGNFDLAR
jgi:hypothetical protein